MDELSENMPPTPLSTQSIANSSRSSASRKRKRQDENNKAQSLMTLVNEKLSSCRREDEYDIIGKNVAQKLRQLPSQMKVFAEKLINDSLFEAQLGNLNRYAFISVPQPLQSMQSNNGYNCTAITQVSCRI